MINLDKINRTGHIQAIKNATEREFAAGQMVQLTDYAENDLYNATDELDATVKKPIVLHASVYTDEEVALNGDGLKPERNGRGYHLETGDIITLPKTMYDGADSLKVGDTVEPQSGKQTYVKATEGTYGFLWEIIEDTTLAGVPAFAMAFYRA